MPADCVASVSEYTGLADVSDCVVSLGGGAAFEGCALPETVTPGTGGDGARKEKLNFIDTRKLFLPCRIYVFAERLLSIFVFIFLHASYR